MEQLIELLSQIQELAGAGIDALKEAAGGGPEGGPPEGGGPEGGRPGGGPPGGGPPEGGPPPQQ